MRKVPSKIWIFVATALPVMMCSLAALVFKGQNCQSIGNNGMNFQFWFRMFRTDQLFQIYCKRYFFKMFQSNLEAFLYILICFVYIAYQPEIRFIDFFSNASGISSWTWSPATRASFAGEPSDRMTLELANSMLSGNFCLAPKCTQIRWVFWAIPFSFQIASAKKNYTPVKLA